MCVLFVPPPPRGFVDPMIQRGGATQVVAQVDDFVEEAESSQAAGGRGNGVAASLFENALQTFRSLPKQTRIELGIADRAKELAYKIREAGRASLSEMTAFTSDSIDLSDAVQESRCSGSR
ncbi:MAG: hypothetical protein WDM88_03145 [Galbitalea sp.]